MSSIENQKSPEENINSYLFNLLNAKILYRIEQAKKNPRQYVHYTSADVALSIIDHNEVWMRKASVMNDSGELWYGRRLIGQHLRGEIGEHFSSVIDSIYPNFSGNLIKNYENLANSIQFNTFLTSISEHSDSEDQIGRLSMWRAYAPRNGVALILDNTPFTTETDALGCYTLPVQYMDNSLFEEYIMDFIERINDASFYLKKIDHSLFERHFNFAMRAAICSIKHPGFLEEREWRVIYNPQWESSRHLIKDIKSVRGVPQVIFKIPLKNIPEKNLNGIDINSFLKKIIVGPSEFGFEIAQALIERLHAAGVTEPNKRVVVSNIPLRAT